MAAPTSDDPTVAHLTRDQLIGRLDEVRRSPADHGTLDLIVARPANGERQVLDEAVLDATMGLVGDNWLARGSRRSPDGSADPMGQLNIMNSRAAALIAQHPDRRPLAGDQLYLDLDLSPDNLPSGTRLTIGEAVIVINDKPHRGCAKFSERFGVDAVRVVNSPEGLALRVRGVCATVEVPGTVRTGDRVSKG